MEALYKFIGELKEKFPEAHVQFDSNSLFLVWNRTKFILDFEADDNGKVVPQVCFHHESNPAYSAHITLLLHKNFRRVRVKSNFEFTDKGEMFEHMDEEELRSDTDPLN